ncbi:hypothetical protein [Marinobacter sp.]|uniref:hypothetical protein n=1 Tax=Marinobacter sp. TaxID=50741 RepID=UPI0019C29E13|nr:hypothetical protein [Marinobacter sp.]MBD3657374.1 hypothetical protein [Marinobacter sp.]
MKFEIGRWGASINIRDFSLSVFLGDVHLKVPSVVEIAWNSTGFYCEKLGKPGREGQE